MEEDRTRRQPRRLLQRRRRRRRRLEASFNRENHARARARRAMFNYEWKPTVAAVPSLSRIDFVADRRPSMKT